MKTPDKLYVVPMKTEIQDAFVGFAYELDRLLVGKTEYIRKDALLEWLKMAVECYSHPDTVNEVDTIRCEGKKLAFQDVINKLNSM